MATVDGLVVAECSPSVPKMPRHTEKDSANCQPYHVVPQIDYDHIRKSTQCALNTSSFRQGMDLS